MPSTASRSLGGSASSLGRSSATVTSPRSTDRRRAAHCPALQKATCHTHFAASCRTSPPPHVGVRARNGGLGGVESILSFGIPSLHTLASVESRMPRTSAKVHKQWQQLITWACGPLLGPPHGSRKLCALHGPSSYTSSAYILSATSHGIAFLALLLHVLLSLRTQHGSCSAPTSGPTAELPSKRNHASCATWDGAGAA